jgi:hypothetical protein
MEFLSIKFYPQVWWIFSSNAQPLMGMQFKPGLVRMTKILILMFFRQYKILCTVQLVSVTPCEARTPLGLGVSRCPTLLWHPYDTCQTGVLNNCFFLYFDTPTIGVRHLYNTHTSRVGRLRQISKPFFFLLLLHTIDTRVTYVFRNVDQLGVIDIIVDYIIFNFFDSRWINKGQILWYLVVELFLMK